MATFTAVCCFGYFQPLHATPSQPDYGPVFYYYLGDHLGSSNVMTDRDGDVVQVYGYHAFGAERYKQNSQAFPVTHRYTGQALDEETGLYFYNARYYDPELGRFTQPDTIVPDAKDPQSFNRYAYVNNNPLKYSDPSGHFAWVPVLVGIAIMAAAGAAVGASMAAIQGGNILMGALTGGIAGGL